MLIRKLSTVLMGLVLLAMDTDHVKLSVEGEMVQFDFGIHDNKLQLYLLTLHKLTSLRIVGQSVSEMLIIHSKELWQQVMTMEMLNFLILKLKCFYGTQT